MPTYLPNFKRIDANGVLRPNPKKVRFQNISADLKNLDQWLLWRYEWQPAANKGKGKWTKVPYQAKNPHALASSTNAATWSPFEKAKVAYLAGDADGVGFVLTESDPFVGVDLDKVLSPNAELSQEIAKIVSALDSYVEVSPSGVGIRIFVKASLVNLHGRKKGDIEIYDNGRYLTVTGDVYGLVKAVQDRQKEVEAFHHLVWPPRPSASLRQPVVPTDADDETVLERAQSNKTGAGFQKLWQGDFSAYPSQSEADLALCSYLRFETGDALRVDALFRKSGLYREKWNEVHYGDGTTYGQQTVETAMNGDVRQQKGSTPSRLTLQSQPTRPIRRYSVAELMERKLPPVNHLVPGLVPTGLSVLASRPKMGKSWLVLDLCLAAAIGGRFLDNNVEKSDVLYLALEDNPRRLQKRLGQLLGTKKPPANFDLWNDCASLDKGGLDDIATWLDEHPKARLIVIDTWVKVAPKKASSADDYTHVSEVLGVLQKIALEREVAILLVHHTKKPFMGSGDVFDQVLGSTALTGIADATLVLTRERMEADAVLSVTGRDIDEHKVALSFDKESGRWSVAGSAEFLAIPSEQRKVYDAIRKGINTPGELAKHLEKSPSNVSNLLKKLVHRGLVTTDGNVGGFYSVNSSEMNECGGMNKDSEASEMNETSEMNEVSEFHDTSLPVVKKNEMAESVKLSSSTVQIPSAPTVISPTSPTSLVFAVEEESEQKEQFAPARGVI